MPPPPKSKFCCWHTILTLVSPCSDGKTLYYPTSPTEDGTALAVSCSISLGAPGSTTTVTVPHTDGGRIWVSKDATLTFLLNPGPAMVTPSPTNTTDPNYNIYWDFCGTNALSPSSGALSGSL